ncbi:MAG: penicillin-binding protein 2 [Chloroflexota bacterium]
MLRCSILAVFTILAGRLWYVQVVMSSYYKSAADTSKIRVEPVEALRGIIYDRAGRQLVWNAPSWNVAIVPHGIPPTRARRIYVELSHLLHGNPKPAQIAAVVHDNRWRAYASVPIKRNVNPDTAMVIKQLHQELPGVRAEPSSIRSYVTGQDPQLSLSHILGYTGETSPDVYKVHHRAFRVERVDATDQVGEAGIESALDPFLHGANGRQKVEVDAGERPIRVIRRGQAVPGDSVTLTLDWKLQKQVSADLAAALQHLGLRRGVAVLEDVQTGKIVSMVSLPSFDNNWFSGGISQKRYNALLHDPSQPLNDLAAGGQFPPGSTYKVVTAAAALATGVADSSREINDTGAIKPCSACPVFHGWKPGGLGNVNVVGALALSSDIYFYTVAGGNPSVGPMPSIGGTRLAKYARLLGLGQQTGIEIPEARGFIPTPAWFNHHPADGIIKNPGDSWTIGYNYNSAIGQGFDLTTPLQMVNVAATIANGGTLYRPRLINKVTGRVDPNGRIYRRPRLLRPFVPSIVRRDFIDPANLALIQEGMHSSVSNSWDTGTSYYMYDPRIDAAGKTGTAEASGGPHAWWIGYAPFNHPRVAICVMVPNANAEGAYVSVPIAHKLLEDYFHLPSSKQNWLSDVQPLLVGASPSQ